MIDQENGYWSMIVHPSRTIVHWNSFKHGHRLDPCENSRLNLTKKKTGQALSLSTKKRISKAVDYMLYTSKWKQYQHFDTGKKFWFRLSFFTATLSAPQIHSDLVIKRDILRPFLDWLRKAYNIDKYIWRLEKQKNGTTHFHMILDRYIPWYVLRSYWNFYQEKLKYISRYSENQKNWHVNGFRPRPWLFDTWPEEAQRRAYIYGITNGFRDPNSTDVHSIKKIKYLNRYICKYLTKTTQNEQEKESSSIQCTNDILRNSGRIYAVSERLSNLRGAETDLDSVTSSQLSLLSTRPNIFTIKSDFFQVWYYSQKELNQKDLRPLKTLLQEYIQLKFPL